MVEGNLITEGYISDMDFKEAQRLEGEGQYDEAEEAYKELLERSRNVQMQDAIMQRIKQMREKQEFAEDEKKDEETEEIFNWEISKRHFVDIIGYQRHKKILRRIIGMPTQRPEAYDRFKLAQSTGIIFYGAPGTGKTALAQAVSGELGIQLATIKVSEILSKHVGESEKKIAQAFAEARRKQPAILFFDEIDVLGMSRDKTSSEGTGAEIRSTITELLTQISDLYKDKGTRIFIIGATNLPWDVDSALTRSGRIEHFIYMTPPSLMDRMKILAYYLDYKTDKYARITKGELLTLAVATTRYSAADIEKVVKMAKLKVIEKRGVGSFITKRDIQQVLRDPDIGRSSLDEWYQKVKHAYISTEKTSVQRSGFLGLKRQKVKTKEQGKLNKAELNIYKPLINDIKRNMRWWHPTNAIRFIAKVI